MHIAGSADSGERMLGFDPLDLAFVLRPLDFHGGFEPFVPHFTFVMSNQGLTAFEPDTGELP